MPDSARITKPGIYTDMPVADYFADPTPSASLTQSLAKLIVERSPLHAYFASPRLNPDYERDDPTKFDLGNAAHALLIGRGKSLQVVEAGDWRTKEAKAAREAAHADGKVAILTEQHERAVAMATSARHQLRMAGLDRAFSEDGDGEVVLAWQDGDVWCRSMVDWLSADRREIWDLKTTGVSAAPHALSMKIANDGWDVQAAMHARGLDVLDPDGAGRRKHYFVCQENEPPFALTISQMPESVLTMGRKKVALAVDLWQRCMATQTWPGYPPTVLLPSYPEFREKQWLDREIERDEQERARPPKFDPRVLMAG